MRKFSQQDIGKRLYVFNENGDLEFTPWKITGISRQGLPIRNNTESQYIPENKYAFVKR